jgi:hypothetical protein
MVGNWALAPRSGRLGPGRAVVLFWNILRQRKFFKRHMETPFTITAIMGCFYIFGVSMNEIQ